MSDSPIIPLEGEEQLDELHRRAIEMMPEVEKEIRHRLGGNRCIAVNNGGIYLYAIQAVRASLRETCRRFLVERTPDRLFSDRVRDQLFFLSVAGLSDAPTPESTYPLNRSHDDPRRESRWPAFDRGSVFERTDAFCVDR